MTTPHKFADLLRIAADDKDALFANDGIGNFDIFYVLLHPNRNWRTVKKTKQVKRWLWANTEGNLSDLMTEDEAKDINKEVLYMQPYTVKLLWSETVFEVEE